MVTINRQLTVAIKQTAKQRVDRATAKIRDNIVATLNRSDEISDPGDAPISKSGELAGSMQNYPAVDRGDSIEGAAGTDLYRLIWLERGTSSIAPRPVLFPSLMRSRDDVMAIMANRGGDNG